MATISEEGDYRESQPVTVRDKLRRGKILEQQAESTKESSDVAFPRKWTIKLKGQHKMRNKDKVLVWYLNQKGILEHPQFMKIHPGNIIVHKSKGHTYDPSGTIKIPLKGKLYDGYLIREIDRMPVNNKDYDAMKGTSRSPENDPILLKMLLQAKIAEVKAAMNKTALLIGALILVGVAIWFFTK